MERWYPSLFIKCKVCGNVESKIEESIQFNSTINKNKGVPTNNKQENIGKTAVDTLSMDIVLLFLKSKTQRLIKTRYPLDKLNYLQSNVTININDGMAFLYFYVSMFLFINILLFLYGKGYYPHEISTVKQDW